MKTALLISALVLMWLILPCANHAQAAGLSNVYENKLIDHIFRGQPFSETSPESFYVSLYNTGCTDSTRGIEVTGGGYARVPIARTLTGWTATHGGNGVSAGTNGTISNANVIKFHVPMSNWGTVVAFGIEDSITGGQQIACGNLTQSKTINYGSVAPVFGAGSLSIRLDN